ncbi:MAG: glycosyltransferase family 39 protein [Lachnospiraceae bacterium]|nr:glycosyltransferase family 39 protein [Lachnospiraceae bacterium]
MILSLTLLVLLAYIRKKDIYRSIIFAVTLWSVLLYIVTELLSLVHQVRRATILMYWLALIAVTAFLVFKYHGTECKEIFFGIGKLIAENKAVFWVSLLFALSMLVLAVRTVPFNIDSMEHYLARVYHWDDNRSIGHYATHVIRQVADPVFPQIIVLHGYILTGRSDLFVNCPQCLAYLLNGVIVFGIMKELQIRKEWCLTGCILFFASPIVFAEALTTQTDHIAAFWTAAFAYLILPLLHDEKSLDFDGKNRGRIVLMALIVGMGYITKPNTCILMLVFLTGLLILCIKRKERIRDMLLFAVIASVIVILITAPEMLRNLVSFRGLSHPEVGKKQLIGTLLPNYVFINFLKNFTYNLPNFWTAQSGEHIKKVVCFLAEVLHVNIDDPAIAEWGRAYIVMPGRSLGCDMGTAPVPFWLLTICAFAYPVPAVRRMMSSVEKRYFSLSVLSILVFCCVLRWEPFVARYMICYMVVFIPAIILFLSRLSYRRTAYAAGAVSLFLSLALLYDLYGVAIDRAFTKTRPEGYFVEEEMMADYLKAAEYLNASGAKKIGLVSSEYRYDYPLPALLRDCERIAHVNVENETAKYEDPDFRPDAVLYIGDEAKREIECHGETYRRIPLDDAVDVAVYIRE